MSSILSFIRVTWHLLIHMCDMTHSQRREALTPHLRDIKTSLHSFICVTWIVWHGKQSLIHMCERALTHSWVNGKKKCKKVWVSWKNGGVQCEWKKDCENDWLSGKKMWTNEWGPTIWQTRHSYIYISMTWRPKISSDASFFLLCFIRNTIKHCLNTNASCHDYEWVIFMFVTWSMQAEFIYVWNNSFVNVPSYIQKCVTSRIWMSYLTYINMSCHIY